MTLPLILRTIRGMVIDTFRQSLASRLFWGMLAITAMAVLICLSMDIRGDSPRKRLDYEIPSMLPKQEADRLGDARVKHDGVEVIGGEVSLGFGMITIPIGRSREDSVRFVQLWMAAAIADTVGVLLALLWTAGFLPSFLEPQSATVLLAKPVPRWAILIGKYLGVVLFVALQATLFVAGTWLALGLKTGVWNGTYWLAVPLLALNFAIFYAVGAFFAVATRSTVASVFGTIMVWLLCWAVNFTYAKMGAENVTGAAPASNTLVSVAYWVLPKPLDMGALFYDALRAEGFSLKAPELEFAQAAGRIHPELSVLTSILFALAMLAAAAYEFRHTDY